MKPTGELTPATKSVRIRPYTPMTSLEPAYVDRTWLLLRDAIIEIQHQNASGLSYEVLYRNSYNLVLHKQGGRLYNGLVQVITEHLRSVATRIENSIGGNFLARLTRAWSEHTTAMKMIRDILMYMDRVYVESKNRERAAAANDPPHLRREQHRLEVYDLGLSIFGEEVARHPRIKQHLLRTLIDLIRRERDGEVIDRGSIKSATQMLIELGIHSHAVYVDDLEGPLLADTEQYYQAESQRLLGELTASEYMKRVEERIREELERVAHYLDALSEPPLKRVVERELIANHMTALVEMDNSGLVSALVHNRLDDLARMYSLFSRVETGLSLIQKHLDVHLKEVGKAIVVADDEAGSAAAAPPAAASSSSSSSSSSSVPAAPGATAKDAGGVKDASRYVQQIIDLRDKYETILLKAFRGDRNFRSTINSCFEFFVNLNPKFPEYLSLYVDELLKNQKGFSEDEIDATLEKAVVVFRQVQEKDVFERYYKQHLAKRLLLAKTVSDDLERSMIAKLKTECGYQFTTKLEGMFRDMALSRDSMERFQRFLDDSNINLGFQVNIRVLTMGYWPASNVSAKVILPAELRHACEVFQTYHAKHHSGRRLFWQTSLGSADIRASFAARRHELSVSTFQMVVLMLFNQQDSYTYQEIAQETEVPPGELKRALQSLACGKYKVLLKEPKTRDVTESDSFTFNDKFTCQLHRLKIQAVAVKENEAERTETRAKVDDDRKHQIEAAIVRIMKARKVLDHNSLILEVITQLRARFAPTPNTIKARIESLIEREFLERTPEDRRMYRYVA
ncbi:Cullin 3 [Capsaspora owczarzaki ATCC 30864]|uniref:Cullin 3 n=1 Tax=Capsaspora owczarzaki (strain ATCC 30864) TaxID=595528 RepID=A0A0D2UE57_CAPO3|nr:Cullin 3 [Capsaspora owczarzaki ATCC 30864]KJE93406.1 Cullin 3 [Capsaspora owczarzaki ATCC 30864]|eukprot:XP_004348026.1 Cullin 3 [Capsaspora owczarzaki ATCC 30864]